MHYLEFGINGYSRYIKFTIGQKIADATGDKKGTKFCGRLVEVEEEEIEGGDEVEEVTEPKCTLKARLGFPYDTPNGASHYGYHADMLDVSEATDDWWVCSWYYSGDLPEWCTYENSEPNGDSAYVANLDDQYEEWEELTEETVKVFNAAGKSYKFKVEVSAIYQKAVSNCLHRRPFFTSRPLLY